MQNGSDEDGTMGSGLQHVIYRRQLRIEGSGPPGMSEFSRGCGEPVRQT